MGLQRAGHDWATFTHPLSITSRTVCRQLWSQGRGWPTVTCWATSSPHQLFKTELCWHTATHVHLLLPQSFLSATTEEWSGSDRNHMKAKPEVFTTLPFAESSPSPALDVCWMVSTKISNQILLTVFFSDREWKTDWQSEICVCFYIQLECSSWVPKHNTIRMINWLKGHSYLI